MLDAFTIYASMILCNNILYFLLLGVNAEIPIGCEQWKLSQPILFCSKMSSFLLLLYFGVNPKYPKVKTHKLQIRINKINHIIGDYVHKTV